MKTLFSSIFLLQLFTLMAQGPTHPAGGSGKSYLENLAPLSSPAIVFDNRYQGVQGSPYFWNDFRNASIITNKQDTLRGVQVRLQLVEPYIEVMANGKVQGQIGFESIKTITINNPDGSLGRYVTKTIDDQVELLELLHEGEVVFYERLRKRLMKADYEGAHSVDKRFDEFVNLFIYYLEDSTGNLHKIKLRAKAFSSLMPAHKTRIHQYFKKTIIKEPKDIFPLLDELKALK